MVISVLNSPLAAGSAPLAELWERYRATASPLERLQTKEQQVAEYLREGILAGEFARGQKLKQAEIAKRLEISITPVREAMKLLEAEGYIHVSAHRGAVVAPFQIERVGELFHLRLTLEPKLALAAVKRLTQHDLDELSAIDEAFRQVSGHKELESVRRGFNYRFHFRLYECADLPQTLHFTRVVWAKYPFDMLSTLPGRGEQVIREHEAIMEGLRQRDVRATAAAMQRHLWTGHRLFKANFALWSLRDQQA